MAKLYYIADLVFEDARNPLTVADAVFRAEAPFDGEILGSRNGPVVTGHIQNGGTGAGTYTEIQIRNTTTGRDYFTTAPRFNVDDEDTNGRAVLSGGVLGMEPTFKAGDILALDINAIPGGSNSAQAVIYLTCGYWRSVD
ncbi:MAG: hypothetical protein Q8P59_06815 [Dehalococcoidia bacterium]|nr:hypothetical protein [Dehalococcoidia bacterium]